MLNRTLKMAFWVLYDHLGKLILANVVWALAILAPGVVGATAFMTGDPGLMLVVGAPMIVFVAAVVAPVMTVGLAYMAKGLIDTRDGSFLDLFRGVKLYWRRAVGVGFAYLLAAVCLPVSVWFYATKLRETAPWLGYAISALALWCILFVGFMAMIVLPALVQKKDGVLGTLKLTALLVLDNPLFCVGLAIQFLVVAGISVIPPVFVFLSGAMAVVLASSAYEMLARKYALAQMNQEGDAATDRPINVISKDGVFVYDDSKDDYLNRGFRDFLFPWKG